MINSHPELKNLSDFLLLNAGFNRDNSLQSGKLAVALYFFHLQKHHLFKTPTDLGQVYLNEIIESYNAPGQFTYAQGLLGAGVVLEHLTGEGLLQENMTEVFDYIGPILLKFIKTNKTSAISIAEGFTGAGLYLFHRLNNAIHQKNGSIDVLKEQLTQHLQQLTLFNPSGHLQNCLPAPEMSIWKGYTGLLLFLQLLKDNSLHNSISENVEKEITVWLFRKLTTDDFNWYKAEVYFGLLHGGIVLRELHLENKLLDAFYSFVTSAQAHLPELDYKNAAFIALLLIITGKKYNYLPACTLGEKIYMQLKAIIANHSIGNIFNFEPANQTFEMGLYRGICGTALPLLSLQTTDYSWLKILGIEIKP